MAESTDAATNNANANDAVEAHNTQDTTPATDTKNENRDVEVAVPPLAIEQADQTYSVFPPRLKKFVIVMTVFASIFSPFSSFVYLPALTPIAESYHRSLSDINLTVTLYQVMQAIGPLFFGDLSDQIGRRPVYMLVFTIYIAANIGLALQKNYVALMVLRAMQSTGSSATIAIGSAVVADLTTAAERGGYVTAVQASTMFAPALAPVIGGILTQYLGWRSTFWFLVIAAGVFLSLYVPLAPETARRIVGNGSIPPPGINRSFGTRYLPLTSPKRDVPFRIPIPNIFAAIRIVFEKDVGPLMIFMSLFVMANFAMLIPLQDVIRRQYHFNDLQVGLCYIPFAIGSIVGAILVGKLLNWNYARVAKSIGVSADKKKGDDLRKFPIERARLDIMWPWTALAVSTIIVWGWVVSSGTSLAVPLIILFLAGFGLSGPVSILTTLLVDLYPMSPGRVSSSFNLTRAAISAVGTAVVQPMLNSWGYGFTYLFMGLLVAVVSPVVLMVRIWGPQWREERYVRFQKQGQN